jgi:hypothetical protein
MPGAGIAAFLERKHAEKTREDAAFERGLILEMKGSTNRPYRQLCPCRCFAYTSCAGKG